MGNYSDNCKFYDLQGEQITHIEGLEVGSEIVKFYTLSGFIYQMHYDHD